MAEISPIGGVGGANASRSIDKLLSNVMLDVFQQSLRNSGMQTSPETQSALQGLRDAINGNQQQAAQQVQPPSSGCGSPSSAGAGGPDGAGAPQGGQGDTAGLMQMLMQLLQMVMQMLSQMQGQGQGGSQSCGANANAGNVAQMLPGMGSPFDSEDESFGDTGMDGFDLSQQAPQQLM